MICDEADNINTLNSIVVNCLDFSISNLQISMETLEINLPQNNVIDGPTTSSTTNNTSTHRSLRTRRGGVTEIDTNLHKINRRVIQRPKKNFFNTEKDIRKFYLKQKLTNFRPTCLETIFEEEHSTDDVDTVNFDTNVNFMGIKKLKRSLSISDFSNIPKATIQRRKKRIKTCLGKIRKIEKFSMEYFLQRLESTTDDIVVHHPNIIPCTVTENALSTLSSSNDNRPKVMTDTNAESILPSTEEKD